MLEKGGGGLARRGIGRSTGAERERSRTGGAGVEVVVHRGAVEGVVVVPARAVGGAEREAPRRVGGRVGGTDLDPDYIPDEKHVIFPNHSSTRNPRAARRAPRRPQHAAAVEPPRRDGRASPCGTSETTTAMSGSIPKSRSSPQRPDSRCQTLPRAPGARRVKTSARAVFQAPACRGREHSKSVYVLSPGGSVDISGSMSSTGTGGSSRASNN